MTIYRHSTPTMRDNNPQSMMRNNNNKLIITLCVISINTIYNIVYHTYNNSYLYFISHHRSYYRYRSPVGVSHYTMFPIHMYSLKLYYSHKIGTFLSTWLATLQVNRLICIFRNMMFPKCLEHFSDFIVINFHVIFFLMKTYIWNTKISTYFLYIRYL